MFWFKVCEAVRDRTGNVAIITALCALPLFGIMGLAIDYALAMSNKSRLDSAADAAVVAAITKAKTEINAGINIATAETDGAAQGQATFKANAGLLAFAQVPTPSITWISNTSGCTSTQTLCAKITYAAASQNQFGRLFNVSSTNISGTSASSSVITPYYQFIFVVDISGSMAIGGTQTDINWLNADQNIINVNGAPCAFACHDPNHYRESQDLRTIAKNDGWTLKIDYVNQSIQTFIASLNSQTKNMQGVFSVGIDTFATYFTVLQAPTTSLTTAKNQAALIDIEPMQPLSVSQGYTTTTSSLNSALAQLNNIGDGSSVNSQKTFFIFLSDGVEDIPGNEIYGRGTDVTYTTACTSIKNAGVTMLSVAAPYPIISLSQDPDGQYQQIVQPFQPPAVPSMTSAMAACASSSQWSYQATDGPGINTAVQSALSQILQGMTRLTQ